MIRTWDIISGASSAHSLVGVAFSVQLRILQVHVSNVDELIDSFYKV